MQVAENFSKIKFTSMSNNPIERELTIKTNFNKKLDCEIFIHIQSPMNTGVALTSVFKIKTADNSHEPVKAKIIDSCKLPLAEITSRFTYLSHAMFAEEFKEVVKKADPKVTDDTELAVYFYKKIAA